MVNSFHHNAETVVASRFVFTESANDDAQNVVGLNFVRTDESNTVVKIVKVVLFVPMNV